MSSRTRARFGFLISPLAGAVLLLACGEDGGSAGSTTASATTSPATTDASGDAGCEPGSEGCPCIDGGECTGQLVCLSETCVRLPDGGTGDAPPTPPTTGATTLTDDSGGGPPECSDVLQCEDGYVCIDSTCTHAWELTWEMRVVAFMPPSCNEGAGGDLDPDYLVWRDGVLLTDAPEEACPSTWPTTVTTIEPFAPTNDPFQVDFWDNDLLSPAELICSWGWDSLGNGEVGPIPALWLAAGGWSGTFDNGCTAEFEFVRVE